jgi:hypothetical protein
MYYRCTIPEQFEEQGVNYFANLGVECHFSKIGYSESKTVLLIETHSNHFIKFIIFSLNHVIILFFLFFSLLSKN